MKKLLVNILEKVDKEFLLDNKYAGIRKKEFSKKPGIYALYDKKGNLYYVGRASDLNGRLTQHLKHNKHSGKWDRFSIFFTKTESTAIEVEAIALSLLWGWTKPEGNTQKPRLKQDKSMRERIVKNMKKIDDTERENMFGGRRSKSFSSSSTLRTRNSRKRPSLKGLVRTNQPLRAEYKKMGKTFHATLLPSGETAYHGKKYSSLSAAGKAATKREQNGWVFWKIQDTSNQWITLDKFVQSKAGAKPTSSGSGFNNTPDEFMRHRAGAYRQHRLSFPVRHKKLLKEETIGGNKSSQENPLTGGKILPLKGEYKGNTYTAELLACRKRVRYGGKIYGSPSAAGKAVTGRSSSNGWDFWSAKDNQGRWVTLNDLRDFFGGKVLSLKGKYKGKTYMAELLACGNRVRYEGKIYGSPSAAGKAVTGSSISGWYFWSAKDRSGQWVLLKDLKVFFGEKAS